MLNTLKIIFCNVIVVLDKKLVGSRMTMPTKNFLNMKALAITSLSLKVTINYKLRHVECTTLVMHQKFS